MSSSCRALLAGERPFYRAKPKRSTGGDQPGRAYAILPSRSADANRMPMQTPPEILHVHTRRVSCDGSGHGVPAALGHPRIFLEIDEHGYVDCGYCDRRFVLEGGPADKADLASKPDISSGASL